jgi:hypothetical protein
MTLPVVFTANGASTYNLTKSLRFRSSASAYLNRTPASSGNRRTWTFSTWVKRGTFANYEAFFGGVKSSGRDDAIRFSESAGSNQLYILFDEGATGLTTTQLFRDPSAWYHIIVAVDTTQATASNRVKLYVNGSQVTAFATASYPAQNYDCGINNSSLQTIGKRPNGDYFDGYQTEINFIDGQQLTPSSFGSTNALTGVWQPAKYTGTYGTNGFYLKFTDTTSTTTLGYDFSGNSNNWTTNNLSLTAGSTYDSMTDVPTLTSATTANYCVFNPLDKGSTNFTFSNGNLTISGASASSATRATMAVSSGKWYWEATPTAIGNGLGVGFAGDSSRFNPATWNAGTYVIYQSDGNKHINGSASAYGATYTTSDVIGVALDMDAGTITFYKNNTSQGTASTGLTGVYLPVFSQTSGATTGTINANFGAGSGFTYTPPTGFVALNTFNLPTSTIVKGNTVMDATTYTGTGSAQSITNAGAFKPDLVWIKGRSAATDHKLTDSVRGTTKSLQSNDNGSEGTDTQGLTAFNTNGFTVGTSTNYNNLSATYVGWNWQAGQGSSSSNTSGSITSTVSVNATAGFSIATYTGNGTAGATVGHGLGVAPSMMIIKSRSTAGTDWGVYHASLGNTVILFLNSSGAYAGPNSAYWNNTSPSSSVFTLGVASELNGNTRTFVAYCWSEIAGFSKFGSYTGNGSTDGTFVYLGFRPKFVIMKKSSAAEDWAVLDSSRSPYNVTTADLYPDLIQGEDVGNARADLLSNGIKFRTVGGQWNLNGATYVYMAFAENPFKNALAR